jgi:hypothetical protein
MIDTVTQSHKRLTAPIADILIKQWPLTQSMKEPQLMVILESLAVRFPPNESPARVKAMFAIYNRCMLGNAKSAEQAFKIWTSPEMAGFLRANAPIVFPLVAPAVRAAIGHWNEGVRRLAASTIASMQRIDEIAYAEAARAPPAPEPDFQQQQNNWVFIAREAARLHKEIELNDSLTRIRKLFEAPVTQSAAAPRPPSVRRTSLQVPSRPLLAPRLAS